LVVGGNAGTLSVLLFLVAVGGGRRWGVFRVANLRTCALSVDAQAARKLGLWSCWLVAELDVGFLAFALSGWFTLVFAGRKPTSKSNCHFGKAVAVAGDQRRREGMFHV
jgi:hypothetical protein